MPRLQRLCPEPRKQQGVETLSPMIEPELGLLEVDNEPSFHDALELCKPMLGIPPRTLDAVDVATASAKSIPTMIDAKMLFVPKINQAIVTSPIVGVDDAFDISAPSYDPLKRMCSGIRNNFDLHIAVTFVQAKYDCLVTRSASSFSFHPAWSEIALVRFEFTSERRSLLRVFSNSRANQRIDAVHGLAVEQGLLRGLHRGQIQCETLH